MRLYQIPVSSNCKKVRVCAAELGTPLELVNLNVAAGANKAPDYLALNPMGKVPTLVDGDFVLFESAAICAYLCSKVPGQTLWPQEPRAQAEVLRWLLWGSWHVLPWAGAIVIERVIRPRQGQPVNEAAVAYALAELDRFVPVLDARLAEQEFAAGAFSVADIALGCGIERVAVAKLDLAPWPRVAAWLQRLQARDSWKRAA
jgi:glutathione S-transferase